MKALLIVAHGSRRVQSNDEVRALTRVVAERASAQYDKVDCAFLELAEPLIPAGVEVKLREGMSGFINIFPEFFLVAQVALPAGVDVRIAPYVGESDAMVDLLLAQGQSLNI